MTTEKLDPIDETFNALLKKFETLQPNQSVAFSGSLTTPKVVFDTYYAPLAEKVMEKGARINIGCGKGADEFLLQLCLDKKYTNVEVFAPTPEKTSEPRAYLCKEFKLTEIPGKFKARDRAMRKGCVECVAFLSNCGGAASGAAANTLSVAADNGEFGPELVGFDFYPVVEFLRARSLPYDKTSAEYVQQAEAKALTEKRQSKEKR